MVGTTVPSPDLPETVLITGASSGLGRHFAAMLARHGAQVVVAARRRDALDELVGEIRYGGGRAYAVQMDVTDVNSVRAAVAQAVEHTGPLHGLVNNSGVTETIAALDQSETSWDRILNTNLRGSWAVATEVARHMKAHGGGSIVNIASILGLRQGGQVTAYATSKAGLVQLTKQLGLELARYGVRVNALAPGYIDTELNHDFFESEPGKVLIKRIPMRRLGRVEDLDGPLLMLLSSASAYMTGSIIAVDGGHLVGTL